MNDMAEIFEPASLKALAPLITLGVGGMLALMTGVFQNLRTLRTIVILSTLSIATVLQIGLVRDPVGPVIQGTYVADATSAMWGVLFCLSTLLAWLFSLHYYREDRPYLTEHDVLMLTTPLGMMLMAGAQDLLVFFVGLELLSIPLYALAGFQRNVSRSVEAGVKYFLLGAFAAGFFLYGTALIYADTGTVSLAALRETGVGQPLAATGVALLVASLFFKVSVFPFYLWVPDVYQGSPTPVTALMATGTKAAAFAFLFNAIFLLPASSAMTIGIIALITMAVGNLGALVQSDVKRMLAYSGIAHAGTVLLVVAAYLAGDGSAEMHSTAVHAALFYLAAYVFTAAGSFGLLAWLESDGEGTTLASVRGLARRRPAVAAAMTLFMLSLGGIPATGGFLGKYLVFAAAIRAEMIAVAIIGALLSVVALGYYLRVIVAMYMQEQDEPAAEARRSPAVPATIATAVCALFVLAMGVLPGWFFDQLK